MTEKNENSSRLIVVSNRLPFQLLEKNNEVTLKESDGGLVSALKSYFERDQETHGTTAKWWIGSGEFPEKRWQKFKRSKKHTGAFNVEPLFIDTKTYNKYYNGFCNATLWPLFHYFPSIVEFDEDTFKAYEEVNRIFADKLLEFVRPNDTLWIHDYQLMLLPGMVRDKMPDVTIGFFLHIPFPSFEVFRLLHTPWKQKIVKGLLGADLIGFHTHEYVQHFLKTVQMVAGLDHQFRNIMAPGRVVKADMFPLGIDYDKFHGASNLPEVQKEKLHIQENFNHRKIIFSVDRLDYTKGITHRLTGFEYFLEQHPEWREKVVFVLVVVPSRQIITKYSERRKMIEEQVGRLNGKYSNLHWQPIIYRYNHLSFTELCALYEASDIGLITPLRDGMNLVAKEYVATCHGKGVLILSELAGAANEMGEAVLVNPLDKAEIASAILTGLTMPQEEQLQRLEMIQQRLKDYTVIHWVNDFLKELKVVKENQKIQATKHLSKAELADIGLKFKHAHHRHLLLDYDGTLVPLAKHPKLAIPNQDLIQLLNILSADTRTEATIISGRDSATLEQWFEGVPVNLIAEHGAAVRMKNGVWQLEKELDQSWKPRIRPTLELFTQRSPGSMVEEKGHTLAWHYRNVDPELGFVRSRELLDSLHHLLRNTPLNVVDGNKVIEVRLAGVDKGTVAAKMLSKDEYDFVLAVGDDTTDEDMFRALGDKAVTIKIGTGNTAAKFSLTNQTEVIQLLNQLLN
ncbi:MAG TPA: bifunctional alpha,alpha-trehalose-phosphate synthase (UDP-forming)/trehalose-phosphatase [Chryseosolibacter sp.]